MLASQSENSVLLINVASGSPHQSFSLQRQKVEQAVTPSQRCSRTGVSPRAFPVCTSLISGANVWSTAAMPPAQNRMPVPPYWSKRKRWKLDTRVSLPCMFTWRRNETSTRGWEHLLIKPTNYTMEIHRFVPSSRVMELSFASFPHFAPILRSSTNDIFSYYWNHKPRGTKWMSGRWFEFWENCCPSHRQIGQVCKNYVHFFMNLKKKSSTLTLPTRTKIEKYNKVEKSSETQLIDRRKIPNEISFRRLCDSDT